jgi:hypothetical protein
MKKRGLDVPAGATILRFDGYGEAVRFAAGLESQGYLRPAHGRHMQGLRPGKYVMFDHDNSYWVAYMGLPKTVVRVEGPGHLHRLDRYKHGKNIGTRFFTFKVFRRNGFAGLYYRCHDCGIFIPVTDSY